MPFISHPDFAELDVIDVFHKELVHPEMPSHPENLKNKHILYRKKFTLNEFNKALLKISADDHYKLYINGAFVGEGPAPSYPSAYYYNEIDVTEYLRKGENTIAVHTYYQGLINRVWVSGDLRQMLFAVLFADGRQVLESDESWKCAYHTGYTAIGKVGYETAFNEEYDSGAGEVGFEIPEFDDNAWGFAKFRKNANYTLLKQPTSILEYEAIDPIKIEPFGTDGLHGFRYDFGREAVGYLKINARGNNGDTVIIRRAEELCSDGSIRWKMRCNCNYEDRFILSGKNDLFNEYDYKAFRYTEILFGDGVEIDDVKFITRHYPFRQANFCSTENEDLKKIYSLCSDTIKYGVQENFLDCPSREKGQYLGDVSISGRAFTALTGDTSMMKKAIRSFAKSSFISPGLMAVSDSSLMQEIADYSLQFPAQVNWLYSVDGDIEFMCSLESCISGLLEYFKGYMNSDCLIEGVREKWNLVDWPANLRDGYDFPITIPIGNGVHNVLNAFWCGFLESVDEYCSIIGKSATGLTERAKESFVRAFYNEKTGLFTDSPLTQHSAIHSNILPLLFDIGTNKDGLIERIVSFIKEKKLSSLGVYMAYFALCALKKHGYDELALELALDKDCWLRMLSLGATTTFEAWGKEQKVNCSLFHPWATAPAVVFTNAVRPY